MKNILDLTKTELEKEILSFGGKKFNTNQVLEWVYKKKTFSFEAMTNLPKAFREKFTKFYTAEAPVLVKKLVSKTGETSKYLLRCSDGELIETVLMSHTGRYTICISSQSGCVYNCAMCSTGKMGFKRNLSIGEITGQVFAAEKDMDPDKYTGAYNIVFMGMGEPLANYVNFKGAFRNFTDRNCFGVSPKRITVSTCGVVPGIEKMLEDGIKTNLSVSLHAVRDNLRDSLVPVNKKFNLNKLFNACAKYAVFSREDLTFEYVMIKGLNDSIKDALELVAILGDIRVKCKVNLIPYNEVNIKGFAPSNNDTLDAWREKLELAGIIVTVRREMGADINAACGQLAGGKQFE